MLDHIQSLPQLSTLDDDFHSIYAVYATRKFMFMLDTHRTGRVRIQDLVCSDVMTEWLELQLPSLSPARVRFVHRAV